MALHPVRPLGETDPPGIGVRLDVSEEYVELRGEFALHEDLGPAHPDDIGDMLDFDRAGVLTPAAFHAGESVEGILSGEVCCLGQGLPHPPPDLVESGVGTAMPRES